MNQDSGPCYLKTNLQSLNNLFHPVRGKTKTVLAEKVDSVPRPSLVQDTIYLVLAGRQFCSIMRILQVIQLNYEDNQFSPGVKRHL